ncbi:unnamed protein product [Ostreobium quekettii]|uniref:Uncharacterized protein n=1 Tax=Ostreobium quekettii TaxID=121088 RepID=A0A8S1IW91_9CHLO|nr:unnamed protein product [Ostreobium quekettii]|eukprot:evm.model.scf_3738.1 EVM.evm.TU.scf_3738.1   scf_3738:8801-10727(-)
MDQLVQHLQRLAHALYVHVVSMLREAPPGALPLTGVIGLAALLAGLYQLGYTRRAPAADRPRADAQPRASRTNSAQYRLGSQKRSCPPGESEVPGSGAQGLPIPLSALRSQLVGISTVTISVPGVLLEQCDVEELEEEATVRPDAVEIVKELGSCVQLYLMAQVSSDIGEAVVRGALEAAGVLGRGKHQIPSHKLLVCETLPGKIAIVRQVEPELHVDGDRRTIEDLQRFIPQQLHIHKPGGQLASCSMGSVGYGESLSDALNIDLR